MFPSLVAALRAVPDPRTPNSFHTLEGILTMAVCAMLCGRTTMLGITQWGKEHGPKLARKLGFRRPYTPSNGTLHYLFRKLDHQAFQRVLRDWLDTIPPAVVHDTLEAVVGKQAVAIDGKAFEGVTHLPGVAVVAAFLHRGGEVIAQQQVPHSDELSGVRTLLEGMTLEGHIVTGDALLAQRDLAQAIVEKKGTTSSRSKATRRRSSAPSRRSSHARRERPLDTR